MLRASAACEAAGFPTASLVSEGFIGQAAATSVGLGMPNLPVALVPGHPGAQSMEELRRNILEVTADRVIENLTRAPEAASEEREPGARDVIFKGGFDAVNRFFCENEPIGRFWRLYLRNVAGFLPHKNDKATYGNTWRVVLAENEDVPDRMVPIV